mmetsp:Transcript_14545/g.54900  ORF Transcript_14545/g.54900 Transcript_14545/m.54900 type:complete len:203 (+) Transcript_14545:643-1251(+)
MRFASTAGEAGPDEAALTRCSCASSKRPAAMHAAPRPASSCWLGPNLSMSSRKAAAASLARSRPEDWFTHALASTARGASSSSFRIVATVSPARSARSMASNEATSKAICSRLSRCRTRDRAIAWSPQAPARVAAMARTRAPLLAAGRPMISSVFSASAALAASAVTLPLASSACRRTSASSRSDVPALTSSSTTTGLPEAM